MIQSIAEVRIGTAFVQIPVALSLAVKWRFRVRFQGAIRKGNHLIGTLSASTGNERRPASGRTVTG